jgi:S-adenosylmethionine/arginine decarboxylase-like enzyme
VHLHHATFRETRTPGPRANARSCDILGSVLGLHWVADALGCDPLRLTAAGVREVLIELPLTLGLTAVGAPSLSEHRVDGVVTVAGVVLLTESHASCHAFPDDGTAQLDVFSCRPFDVELARRFVLKHLGASELSDSVLRRGTTESRPRSPLALVRHAR